MVLFRLGQSLQTTAAPYYEEIQQCEECRSSVPEEANPWKRKCARRAPCLLLACASASLLSTAAAADLAGPSAGSCSLEVKEWCPGLAGKGGNNQDSAFWNKIRSQS